MSSQQKMVNQIQRLINLYDMKLREGFLIIITQKPDLGTISRKKEKKKATKKAQRFENVYALSKQINVMQFLN